MTGQPRLADAMLRSLCFERDQGMENGMKDPLHEEPCRRSRFRGRLLKVFRDRVSPLMVRRPAG